MNQLKQDDMQQHVTIVGWLYIIGHVFFVVIGGFVFVLMLSIGFVTRDPEALPILSIVGTWTALFLTVLALPGLIAGIGLLKRQMWGRVLAIIVAFFGLINFPIGTAISVYALFVLLQNAAGNTLRHSNLQHEDYWGSRSVPDATSCSRLGAGTISAK